MVSCPSVPPFGSVAAAWQVVMRLLEAKGRFERAAYNEACKAAGIPAEKREDLRTTFRPRGGCSIRAIPIPTGGALRSSRRRTR